MKFQFTYILAIAAIINLSAQKKDTINVDANNLNMKNLKYGKSTYLVYSRAGKNKPMQNTTLVKITTHKEHFEGKNFVVINQIWETDTIIHTAKTRFENNTMKTIHHTSWWKKKGYSEYFDFSKGKVTFNGDLKVEVKDDITKSFNTAISSNFLNWHSDLVIFPLLPFKENRVFKINFYEPGFASPKDEVYEVLGSEKLSIAGSTTDCWVLNYQVKKPSGYQRFWISKKTNELIKEEDSFGSFYRYKLKLIIDEN